MKEKILLFLKGKLSGVQVTYLDGVADLYSKTITEESQIETVLNDGVISVLKHSATQIQTEGDRRATDATQTAITNYEKKHNLKDGKAVQGGGTPPNPNPDDGKTPDWAKAIIESNKALTEKVTAFELEKSQLSKKEQAQSALKTSELPDTLKAKWAGRIDVDSETSIEDQVKELEEEYSNLHTDIVGENAGKGLPVGGGTEGEASDEEAQEVLDKL